MAADEFVLKHIGIIMDGNGRWAQSRALPRAAGHKKGAKVFGDIAKYCKEIGLAYLTVYAFSTENFKRPKAEVDAIMDLLKQYLNDIIKSSEKGVRLNFLGDRNGLDSEILTLMQQAEEKTSTFDEFTVNIALNYGGRAEIVGSIKKISERVKSGEISTDDIDEEMVSQSIYTALIPDPDLIIRPGGEKRISNFLLWQSAYSEFVFMDVLWPDFQNKHIDEAISIFMARNRRFGGV